MAEGKVIVLDPTLRIPEATVLSPRLDTLSGKTIGIIWNGRPPGDVIFNKLFESLGKRYAIKEVLLREKPYLGNVAPEAILDELEERCDAVVTGVGD